MRPTGDAFTDFSEARREATAILGHRQNRLTLIGAILVLLVLVPVYITGYASYFSLAQLWCGLFAWRMMLASFLYFLLTALFTLLFTLPATVGLAWMAGDMATGGDAVLSDLFAPFSDKARYRCALKASWSLFWRVGIIVAVVALTCHLTVFFFEGSLVAGLLCGLLVVLEIASGLWCSLGGFSAWAVSYAQKDSRERMPWRNGRDKARGLCYLIGFLPQILLGILSLGILLLWDVLPMMSVTYFRYVMPNLKTTTIQSEEYQNHE